MIIADISILCREQSLIELQWYCLSSLLKPPFFVHLVPIGLCLCWLSLKIWLLWMSFPSVISYLSNILTYQRESGLSIRCFIFWTDLCYYCIKWKGAITAHELHKDPVSTKRRKHSWFLYAEITSWCYCMYTWYVKDLYPITSRGMTK